jgi:hypothetical protein
LPTGQRLIPRCSPAEDHVWHMQRLGHSPRQIRSYSLRPHSWKCSSAKRRACSRPRPGGRR